MLSRTALVRTLKAIGEIPVPAGHAKRHKGVTSFFYAPEKKEALEAVLVGLGLVDQGQNPRFVQGFHAWEAPTGHRVSVCKQNDENFVALGLLSWPDPS